MILEGVSDRTRVRMARVMVGTALALAVVAVVLYVIEGEASRLVEDWIPAQRPCHRVPRGRRMACASRTRAKRSAVGSVWASAFGALTAFGAAVGLTQTRIVSSDIEAGLVTVAPADLDTIGALGFLLARALWVPSLFLILTLGPPALSRRRTAITALEMGRPGVGVGHHRAHACLRVGCPTVVIGSLPQRRLGECGAIHRSHVAVGAAVGAHCVAGLVPAFPPQLRGNETAVPVGHVGPLRSSG